MKEKMVEKKEKINLEDYMYDYIGITDGWMKFDRKRYEECQKVLEMNEWIEKS